MQITMVSRLGLAFRGKVLTRTGKELARLAVGTQRLLAGAERFFTRAELEITAAQRELAALQLHDLGLVPPSEPLSDRYYHLLQAAAEERGLTLTQPSELRAVAETVEKRRQTVAQAAMRQVSQLDSPTVDKLGLVNPAERKWLETISRAIVPLVTEIFDRQCWPDRPQEEYLARLDPRDAASRFHLIRIRTAVLPMLRPAFVPAGIREYKKYASSLPWFPAGPTYNGMWPADMTPEELDYLRKNHPNDHEVFRPYTMVERLSKEIKARIIKDGLLKNGKGQKVETIIRGLEGQEYRVVNICFHENYRPTLLKIAGHLRSSANIEVDGHALNPSFRNYLKTAAEAIEEGNFVKWLKADLEQKEGNLFFTLFPHEGYWADNIKFPFIMEIGIRDIKAGKVANDHLDIAKQLKERVGRMQRELGFNETQVTDPGGTSEDSTEFIWIYTAAGFIEAFPDGAPLGHDYPKVSYPGIRSHRNVVILDANLAVSQANMELVEKLFGPELARLYLPEITRDFAAWHEAQHSMIGNRPDTRMKDGRSLGETFGELWGFLAEPAADIGSLTAHNLLYKAGKRTENHYHGISLASVFRSVSRIYPKEVACSEDFIKEALHVAGTMLYLGFIFKEGNTIVRFTEDNILEIDFSRLTAAIEKLDQKLIEFGLTGNPETFKTFYRECVETIPDEFIERAQAITDPLRRMHLVKRPGNPT